MAERKSESECRVELLIGRKVRAADGRAIGRIEELRAEREGNDYVVTEFHLGPIALIEALAVRHLGLTLLGRAHGYRVRWDQLDLSDQEQPRLTCPVEEVERIGAPRRRHRKKHAA